MLSTSPLYSGCGVRSAVTRVDNLNVSERDSILIYSCYHLLHSNTDFLLKIEYCKRTCKNQYLNISSPYPVLLSVQPHYSHSSHLSFKERHGSIHVLMYEWKFVDPDLKSSMFHFARS